jgi:serine/threonine-protein kinase HipA
MLISGQKRFSQLKTCLEAAPNFLLREERAYTMINTQLKIIRSTWESVCNEANLSQVDRAYLWGRQFLNPFALEGWTET